MPTTSALLTSPTPRTKRSDFAPLLREIKSSGLLERRTRQYLVSIVVNLLCLAAVVAGLILLGNSWLVLLLAVPAAIFTTRAAFFGHDAGHQQIGRSRRLHDAVGQLHANLLLGMSYGWWNDKHNRHHWGHLEKQVRTSRNVNGHPVNDWMMGGRNYQIEHHLFPNMPRANLRHAQGAVRAYCQHVGVPYLSTGIVDSYAQGLRHMHDVGRQLRHPTATPPAS